MSPVNKPLDVNTCRAFADTDAATMRTHAEYVLEKLAGVISGIGDQIDTLSVLEKLAGVLSCQSDRSRARDCPQRRRR